MRMWLRLGLLLGVPLGLYVSAAGAVDWGALRPQGYVSDFANVIDAPARRQLEAYCAAVERSTGLQIALVVLPSLEREPVADVARALYRAWDVGKGVGLKKKGILPTTAGILFLLAVLDQRSRLEIGPGLRANLPGGFDGRVQREMRPALRQQEYGEALMAAAETIGRTAAQAKKAAPIASLPRRLRPGPFDWIPWPAVIGGVLLLFWMMRAGGRRGDGRSGGGGFGGYDSADRGVGGFG